MKLKEFRGIQNIQIFYTYNQTANVYSEINRLREK